MRLVHQDPVRTTGARSKVLKTREQPREERGTLGEGEAEEIDDHVAVRLLQHFQRPRHRRRALLVPEHDAAFQQRVVAFRIHDAELIALAGETREEARGERRLPASRGLGDQNGQAVGIEPNLVTLRASPYGDGVAREPALQIREVIGDELVDQLDHALAVPARGDPIGPLPHEGKGIGDRDATFAEPYQRMIVLGVTHAHRVMRRQAQLEESGFEASGLVHTRGEDHDRPFVEDDLQLEPEVTNRLEDLALVRLPGRHDAVTDGKRGDPAATKRLHELRGGSLPERLVLSVRGAVQESAVLGHHAIEDVDSWEDLQQIVDFPARDEDELPAGVPQPLEGRERLVADCSIGGYRSVEITGQDKIAHGSIHSSNAERRNERATIRYASIRRKESRESRV